MAGVKGAGGRSFQDREQSARVRTLALSEIEKVLKNPKSKLYGPVLIKLAGSVLPRLNEHTGADGADLPQPIFQINAVPTNNSDPQGIETE